MTQSDGPGPMESALVEALKEAPVLPRDQGAVALALRYAALIDEATPASKYRDPMRHINRAISPADEKALEAWAKIADALAAHSVMSDLGPKLLATLAALGMSVSGRDAKSGGAPNGPQVSDELAALRDRAKTRRSGAN